MLTENLVSRHQSLQTLNTDGDGNFLIADEVLTLTNPLQVKSVGSPRTQHSNLPAVREI